MNKGTAIIGFFLCFVTGMGLMFAIDRGKGSASLSAEPASAAADESSSPIPVTSKDPQLGNADALVTIVQVSDFQCPFCSRVEPTITQIRQQYKPDQVRVVWKNNPLPFHQNARPAADAAATVFGLGGNDAFWKFHAKAFEGQKELSDANYEKWAVEAGVKLDKFKEALKSKKFTSKVDEDLAVSRKIGISGTPGFRINGVLLSGAQPLPKFKEVIDAQIKAAQDLIKSGTKKSEVSLALTKTNFTAPADNGKPAAPSNNPPAADNTVWRVDVASDDPVRGGKNALVTIVEWSDFQCPFCAKVEPALKQVRDMYKDDVRIVWKDNPLPFHPRAKPASTLARAAYLKGGDALFWKAHDELYDGQKLEDTDLEALAKKLGLDWAGVKAAIDSKKFDDRFAKTMDQADALEARGTPHFFINGVRLTGAQPFEKFKATIDEQLAKAKAVAKNGVAPDQVYAEIMKTAKAAGTLEKKDVPPPGPTTPVKGNGGAKVAITIFSDFQCPFCSRVEPTLAQIEKEYGDKVKFVWRNMPLPFHENAPLAAEAAQEAFAQKGSAGFWKFHDTLFSNQQAITRPDLEKYAQAQGLDMAKFKAALDSHKHKPLLDSDVAMAQKVGVNGTPAFFVNGYFLSGAQPFEKFDKLIKVALKD